MPDYILKTLTDKLSDDDFIITKRAYVVNLLKILNLPNKPNDKLDSLVMPMTREQFAIELAEVGHDWVFFIKGYDPLGNPYKEEVYLKDAILGKEHITVVVIDQDAYNLLLDELLAHPVTDAVDFDESVAKMRCSCYIPAIGRGNKTEWIFDRYNVTTDIMGIMTRGKGKEVLKNLRNG